MGILNLEFAYNTSKITPILFSWESINRVDIITQQKIIPIGIFISIVLFNKHNNLRICMA